MQVKYSHGEGTFPFVAEQRVTIVVRYLYTNDPDEELYYHGVLTKVEADGFWCVLEGEQQEEYFSFADVESVIDGNRIPFLGGTAERLPRVNKG